MTPTLAITLALIVIGLFGLLFGILLSLLGVLAYSIYRTAAAQQTSTSTWRLEIGKLLSDTSSTADRLRMDLLAAISKLDADRLYEASHAIQRGAASLTAQTQTLGKLIYASADAATGIAGTTNALNMGAALSSFTMEDEAEDDARMAREKSRWASTGGGYNYSAGPPPTGLTYPEDLTDTSAQTQVQPDPYAGFTQEQRQKIISDYWEARRAGVGVAGGKTAAQVLAEAGYAKAQSFQSATLPDLHDDNTSVQADSFVPIKSEMED